MKQWNTYDFCLSALTLPSLNSHSEHVQVVELPVLLLASDDLLLPLFSRILKHHVLVEVGRSEEYVVTALVSVEVRHGDESGPGLRGLGGDGVLVVVTLVSFDLEADSPGCFTGLLCFHVEVASVESTHGHVFLRLVAAGQSSLAV